MNVDWKSKNLKTSQKSTRATGAECRQNIIVLYKCNIFKRKGEAFAHTETNERKWRQLVERQQVAKRDKGSKTKDYQNNTKSD